MIESMTGFAELSAATDRAYIHVTARSVNNRNLRIYTTCNRPWPAVEEQAHRIARTLFERGTITVTVHVTVDPLSPALVEEALGRIGKLPSLPPGMGVELGSILRILQAADTCGSMPPAVRERTESLIPEVLRLLKESRRREGASLAEHIMEHARAVRAAAARLKERLPLVREEREKTFLRTVNDLLRACDARLRREEIAQALAVHMEKTDVTEEVDRIGLHAGTLIETITGPETAVGKKIDFLCQELHREVNTLGAKVRESSVVAETVSMKTDIEKLREQVHNVQ